MCYLLIPLFPIYLRMTVLMFDTFFHSSVDATENRVPCMLIFVASASEDALIPPLSVSQVLRLKALLASCLNISISLNVQAFYHVVQ